MASNNINSPSTSNYQSKRALFRAKSLRSQTPRQSWLFGQYGKLPKNVLPLNIDVIKYFYYLQQDDGKKHTNNSKGKFKNFNLIVDEIIGIWKRASIPCMNRSAVKTAVMRLVGKATKFENNHRSQKNKEKWIHPALIDNNYYNLFDICKCPHFRDISEIEKIHEHKCDCKEKIMVTKIDSTDHSDLEFYIDQKFERKYR